MDFISFHGTHPGLSDEDIATLEATYSAKLPEDYREFLKQYNGGQPDPRRVSFEEKGQTRSVEVFQLRGVHSGAHSLNALIDTNLTRIVSGMLPIGDDGQKNLFLIRTQEPHLGAIYFWDHDGQELPPSQENIYLIATSFTNFLHMLHAPSHFG
jgi:hypothetical protein